MRRLRTSSALVVLALSLANVLPAAASADGLAASSVDLTGPSSVVDGTEVVLTATVTAPDGYDTDATIDFTPILGGGPSCTAVPVSTSGTECHLPGLAVGSYTYEAAYSGNLATAPSTSAQVTFDVTPVPDTTVDATGVTSAPGTFYPALDGYLDTVAITGTRGEPISATIEVRGPTNVLVASFDVPAASGPYEVAWSGRDTGGTMLPPGTYTITQTLTDAANNQLVVTTTAALSPKKLVSKTAVFDKLGRSISASSGAVVVSASGYLKLDARHTRKSVGYGFTIPKATRYTALSFKVYAKGPRTSPANTISLQDFAICPYVAGSWVLSCFDHRQPIGGSKTAWYRTTGSPSANRSGTRVRAAIAAVRGVTYIYRVRLTVAYQVLQ